jgi:hypothetical protein
MAYPHLKLTAALLLVGATAVACAPPSGPPTTSIPAAGGQASPAAQYGGLTGTLPQAQGGTLPNSGTLQQPDPRLPVGIYPAPGRDAAPQLDTGTTRPVVPGQSVPR